MAMAELQYAMRDVHESMVLATKDNRWSDVAKYATQLEAMAAQHVQEFRCVYTLLGVGVSRCE